MAWCEVAIEIRVEVGGGGGRSCGSVGRIGLDGRGILGRRDRWGLLFGRGGSNIAFYVFSAGVELNLGAISVDMIRQPELVRIHVQVRRGVDLGETGG